LFHIALARVPGRPRSLTWFRALRLGWHELAGELAGESDALRGRRISLRSVRCKFTGEDLLSSGFVDTSHSDGLLSAGRWWWRGCSGARRQTPEERIIAVPTTRASSRVKRSLIESLLLDFR